METDLEKRAKEAFVDDNFDLAVDLYTQALDMDPKNADLYADRAQANIKLDNFTEAVADANKAIELDPSIAKAYLRKGTACIKLEEYQTAKTALEAGASLAPGDSRFTRLIKECDERIAEETIDLPKKVMPNALPSTMSPPSNITAEIRKDPQSPKDSPCQSAVIPNKPKYRHDYYNSSTEVVLTIFAKGIPANNVSVDFGEQMLSVIIDIPGEQKYHFQPRLFGKIIPEKCRYTVMSSKIEIRLSKAEPITWTSLEFSDKRTVPQRINTSSVPMSKRPSYPSSKAKIDWDKLEALVKKEEKEEKLDGDAGLNKVFQDMYRDADEDTRRAMNKSFIESSGTVLSTNWKDVGSKKVEGSPPEGLELKKWEL
ncbi:protein SGT1 homolog [Phoenix dactylifera]|uniref:Protein SGT1 homolog n=1 Tax=Phoenix dactylifera TaxID=42345 RepID=A0A8B7CA78_PHODC|nr:protein SGT1 homolog [Phoenix dactylifera]